MDADDAYEGLIVELEDPPAHPVDDLLHRAAGDNAQARFPELDLY